MISFKILQVIIHPSSEDSPRLAYQAELCAGDTSQELCYFLPEPAMAEGLTYNIGPLKPLRSSQASPESPHSSTEPPQLEVHINKL